MRYERGIRILRAPKERGTLMKRASLILSALLLVFGLLSHPAFAATIRVSTDLPTIQAGIDASSGGDLVLVASGTYVENIDYLGKAITLQSEGGADVTVIDGNQAGSVVTFSTAETETSVLNGFKIRNGNSYDGGGIHCSEASPTITNCTIIENVADHNGGGIWCYPNSSPTITNCTISGNSTGNDGAGIFCYDGSSPQISNCIITGNITPYSGGGIFCRIGSNATITHCTISANAAGNAAGIYSHSSNPIITNCIVWQNYFSEIGGYPLPQLVTYCDIKGGWEGAGNINEDPLFVGGGDYHLYLLSPCVDAGRNERVYTDLDGRPRPQRAGFDMGAYEYPDCDDGDSDGYGDPACGGYDCDDTESGVNPGAEEVCTNGIDDDCDGLIDMDDPQCGNIHIPADYPTIQAGIDAAQEGVLILVSPGTYMENIDFRGKTLTVRSEQGVDDTVIDGSQTVNVVTFEWGETRETVIDGFTITNGAGGIKVMNSSPTITNCTISRNNVNGIYCNTSSPEVTNCTIRENYYSGIRCEFSSLGITVRNCVITKNGNNGFGGGISCRESENNIIENCTISKNRAEHGGGICFWDYSYPTTITNCTISENIAYNGYGGGGRITYSPITITNCLIYGNQAFRSLGNAMGGGLSIEAYSESTLTNCQFINNSSGSTGGGLQLYGHSDSTIRNCTFTGNNASEQGGGLCITTSGSLIENCTITGNNAGENGGGIYYDDDYHTLTNTILWGNTAPEGPEIGLVWHLVLGVSYSDVQAGEEAVSFEHNPTLNWLEGNIDEDPLFIGGGDYMLIAGSPCIDAGNPFSSYYDECFPPSMGTKLDDMGAYGGPGACEWCGDHDGDGYESVICGGEDCYDPYVYAYPGAEEICDGLDNDCDGGVPVEEADVDGDGWMACGGDCDDEDPLIYPGAEEICDNGIDDDCDGLIDLEDLPQCCWDDDGDGHSDVACGGRDCDDADPLVNPGADENCGNGIDDDCDGYVDLYDYECKEFTLDLIAYYWAGEVHMEFTLGTLCRSKWMNYLISIVPTIQVIPLWSVQLPGIWPPESLSISFPFPEIGGFWIYSGLFYEGVQAYGLAWVYAG